MFLCPSLWPLYSDRDWERKGKFTHEADLRIFISSFPLTFHWSKLHHTVPLNSRGSWEIYSCWENSPWLLFVPGCLFLTRIFFFTFPGPMLKGREKKIRKEGRKERRKRAKEGRKETHLHKSHIYFSRDFYHVLLLLKTKTKNRKQNKKITKNLICNFCLFFYSGLIQKDKKTKLQKICDNP